MEHSLRVRIYISINPVALEITHMEKISLFLAQDSSPKPQTLSNCLLKSAFECQINLSYLGGYI